jgi:hypothetical protein
MTGPTWCLLIAAVFVIVALYWRVDAEEAKRDELERRRREGGW